MKQNKLGVIALLSYIVATIFLITYKKPQRKYKPVKINISKVIELENQVKL